MISSITRIRYATSASARRLRFSVEQMNTVTSLMPTASHQDSTCSACSAPARCPMLGLASPAWRAQRRLPSMISPTCPGSGPASTCCRSRRV